jgi:hypothetical protein
MTVIISRNYAGNFLQGDSTGEDSRAATTTRFVANAHVANPKKERAFCVTEIGTTFGTIKPQ